MSEEFWKSDEKLEQARDFLLNRLNIRSKEDIEMRLKVNRTHEECNDCKLEWVNPPQCEGHVAGETSCKDFKGK